MAERRPDPDPDVVRREKQRLEETEELERADSPEDDEEEPDDDE
jgi:hypothetical protein